MPELLLAGWLVAAALVTTRVYRQLPHILDAISYTFQASLFASGKLALDAPPVSLFRIHLDTASVSIVDYFADGNSSVRLVNDTSHLA